MKQVGTTLSLIGILGTAILLSMLVEGIREAIEASPVLFNILSIIGAITAFAILIGWGLAIYHWGAHFDGHPPQKRAWGIVVIFGAFVGAWIYWLGKPGSKRSEHVGI